MIAPLLVQIQAEPDGPGVGEILIGVVILAALAWLGARIIASRGGPKA